MTNPTKITRSDLSRFLAAYYGAVTLDRIHVAEQWGTDKRVRELEKEYRDGHLRQIKLVSDTLQYVSKKTLKRLSDLAASRQPTDVRRLMRHLLSEGATVHYTGERMWTASEFFDALLSEAEEELVASLESGDAVIQMMRWVHPTNPLGVIPARH